MHPGYSSRQRTGHLGVDAILEEMVPIALKLPPAVVERKDRARRVPVLRFGDGIAVVGQRCWGADRKVGTEPLALQAD